MRPAGDFEMFDGQEFSAPADQRIVKNEPHLRKNRPNHRVLGQAFHLREKGGVCPVGLCKDRVRLVTRHDALQQGVQNILLAGKMTVQRGLSDADRRCDLRNGRGLVSLYREQGERGFKDSFACGGLGHMHRPLAAANLTSTVYLPNGRLPRSASGIEGGVADVGGTRKAHSPPRGRGCHVTASFRHAPLPCWI